MATANLNSSLKKELDVQECPKDQCLTVNFLKKFKEMKVLENRTTSIKAMSSSYDDNDFPACSTCWNKGQCEMLKSNGWLRVFRSVFNIVKSQRPFTDLPQQIGLQVLNEICMGRILLSDKTCAGFAIHRLQK